NGSKAISIWARKRGRTLFTTGAKRRCPRGASSWGPPSLTTCNPTCASPGKKSLAPCWPRCGSRTWRKGSASSTGPPTATARSSLPAAARRPGLSGATRRRGCWASTSACPRRWRSSPLPAGAIPFTATSTPTAKTPSTSTPTARWSPPAGCERAGGGRAQAARPPATWAGAPARARPARRPLCLLVVRLLLVFHLGQQLQPGRRGVAQDGGHRADEQGDEGDGRGVGADQGVAGGRRHQVHRGQLRQRGSVGFADGHDGIPQGAGVAHRLDEPPVVAGQA